MSTPYIVRVIGTNQLVGLLVVSSYEDLFWSVDEVCDPHGCEYKELTSGGGVQWDIGGDVYSPVPNDDGEGGFELASLDGAYLTPRTLEQYEGTAIPWQRFLHKGMLPL